MVTDRGLFLIDSSSLFEGTHKKFLGTPLILNGGKDNTFLYGFFKYLLTLRRELGIGAAVVLISRECWGGASEQEVKETAELIAEIGIPVVNEKNHPSLTFVINMHLLPEPSIQRTKHCSNSSVKTYA